MVGFRPHPASLPNKFVGRNSVIFSAELNFFISMASRAMSALCEVLPTKRMWKRGDDTAGGKEFLPISSSDEQKIAQAGGLRKRISSSFGSRSGAEGTRSWDSSAGSWSFRRSRSMEEGNRETSFWKWWDWSRGWIASAKKTISRKMAYAWEGDLVLGYDTSSWRHSFRKLRAHLRKMADKGPASAVTQKLKFRYDALSYAQNFDDGGLQDQEAQPQSKKGSDPPGKQSS